MGLEPGKLALLIAAEVPVHEVTLLEFVGVCELSAGMDYDGFDRANFHIPDDGHLHYARCRSCESYNNYWKIESHIFGVIHACGCCLHPLEGDPEEEPVEELETI